MGRMKHSCENMKVKTNFECHSGIVCWLRERPHGYDNSQSCTLLCSDNNHDQSVQDLCIFCWSFGRVLLPPSCVPAAIPVEFHWFVAKGICYRLVSTASFCFLWGLWLWKSLWGLSSFLTEPSLSRLVYLWLQASWSVRL
jgi:hypothetical protein